MKIIEIFGIAVGLSMDALSVSVVNGCLIKNIKLKSALRIAFFFGFFQAIMPLIGWYCGLTFNRYIADFDHWIAFVLLCLIGVRMIFESQKRNKECSTKNCLHLPTLIILSLATSIDALAVGVSFSMLNINIIIPVVIIGLVTFIICIAGIYIGNKIGHFFEDKLELLGGFILIGIGFKILIENLLLAS